MVQSAARLKIGEDKLLKFNEDNNIINYYYNPHENNHDNNNRGHLNNNYHSHHDHPRGQYADIWWHIHDA